MILIEFKNYLLEVCFYREKHVNQSLKMQNKWNSFVKERSFTQIL